MKKALLLALVCVNAALLVALVSTVGIQKADAQVIGGGANYLLMTAKAADAYDALFILDLRTRQLAVWKFDRRSNQAVFVAKRDLRRDFRRETDLD